VRRVLGAGGASHEQHADRAPTDAFPTAEPQAIDPLLAAVLECTSDAIVAIGGDGHVVLCNGAAARLFQCSAAVVRGRPIERFIVASGFQEHVLRAGSGDVDVTAIRADGKTFSAHGVVTDVDAAGTNLRVIVLREVSDQRAAGQTVTTLSIALEHIADSVFIADADGVIEYVNRAFVDLMGFDAHDVIGRTPRLFKSEEHDPASYDRLWSTLRAGDVFRGVFIDKTADGDLIHLDEVITPIRDVTGRITHFVAAARDITLRVRTEATLRRLNESLDQQAKRIAQALHDEAGQLLTAAYMDLASAVHDVPLARERLQTIKANLAQIEEQFRRVAHELRPRILDDYGLVPALEFLAAGVEERHGITVAVTGAVERLPTIVETTIYRVVHEALTNVCKHSGARRVTVDLAQMPGILRCTIKDDGVGFDEPAVDARFGERGFGLAGTTEQIVGLGGTVRIVSGRGKGTEIIIGVPMEL
jgi:two-component system, NarL family, sensor histidine kinase NreB